MKNVMLLLRELLSEKPTEVFSGEKARIAHLPSGFWPIFESLFCLIQHFLDLFRTHFDHSCDLI